MALPLELTLEDYWRILRRRRWLFSSIFAVTLGLTAVFTFRQAPVYSAYATLKIEPPAGATGVASAFKNWDPWTGVSTEMRVIDSAAVAEATLRRTGHIDASTPPNEIGTRLADFMGRSKAERVGDTSLVNLVVEALDPGEAAEQAQALAEAYMDQDVESRRRQNEQALINIDKRKGEIEGVLHGLEDRKRRMVESAPTSGLQAGAMSEKLFELENKRKVLLQNYTSAHPEVQRVTQEIEVLDRQLKSLPKGALEVARVERDIQVNQSLYVDLARQYEEQRVAAASVVSLASLVSRATPNPTPVRPNRKANLMFGATMGLVLGLIMVFVAENLDTSLVTVEEVEKALELPVLGLIPHIPLPDRKERPNYLFWLPNMIGKHEPIEDLRKRMIIYQPAQSPVVESYHSLRTSMESILPPKSGHVVVFTSSGVAEGKTLSCMNFALSAVTAGARVLLMEVDLRRPSLHRMLGVPNDVGLTNVLIEGLPTEKAIKGVADFMIGTAKVEVLLRTQGIENLYLLSNGTIKVNPTDLFKRAEFKDLLAKLRKNYDWVLLDCPPLLLFADGLMVSPLTDGVVLFYQVGRMARSALKRAKEELQTVKARPLGIVLNDVRPKELEPRYGYYQSYDYYHYYTPEEETKKHST